MSEQSQGPGWWQASDGRWYPPEQAPAELQQQPPPTQPFGATPPPTAPIPTAMPTAPAGPEPAPAPRSGIGTGPIIAIVVAAIAIIAGIVFFATKDDGNKKNAAATESSTSSSSSSSSSSGSRSSSSSSGAPKISAPTGFKAFSSNEGQFAIAIPERLEVIDLTAADLDQVLQNLGDANPTLAKLVPQIRQVFQNGGTLFAIDTTSGQQAGFNDNVNIIAAPGSVDVTAASTKSQAESQLSSIKATNIEFQTLTSKGRKILVSSYQATVNTADGTPVTFFGRQAIISAGGKIWFITFSTGADDPTTFQTMAESFDVSE